MPRMTTWDRKIRLCEIEARPKKLGPHIVRNRPEAWVRLEPRRFGE